MQITSASMAWLLLQENEQVQYLQKIAQMRKKSSGPKNNMDEHCHSEAPIQLPSSPSTASSRTTTAPPSWRLMMGFDYLIEFAFIAYSTLSADTMLSRFAIVLCRPTEYLRLWDKAS